MKVCGIDPGAKGAICVLDSNDPAYIALLDLANTSQYEIAKFLHKQQVDKIFIEDVHSLYGMSAKSNFNFGYAVGIVQTIANIILQGKDFILVQPKQWQKAVGVTEKGSKFIKPQVAELATKYYPHAILNGKRGALQDGRSDAIMIAHYGLHHHKE